MFKRIAIMLMLAGSLQAQEDFQILPYSDLWRFVGGGTAPVAPVWTNSMHEISRPLWTNTVAEYLFDTNNLSWTNNNYISDSSYIGTNHLARTGGSTDPAWRASTNNAVYGTNGWWEFDGSDDYLARVNADTNQFSLKKGGTISFWAKHSNKLTYECAISYGDWAQEFWNFYIYESGYMYFQVYGDGHSGEMHKGITTTIVSTNWVHYCITWDGQPNVTNVKIYTNSAELSTYNFTADTVTTYNGDSTGDLRIGKLHATFGWYRGNIDSTTVATNIWTATQVTNYYQSLTNRMR